MAISRIAKEAAKRKTRADKAARDGKNKYRQVSSGGSEGSEGIVLKNQAKTLGQRMAEILGTIDTLPTDTIPADTFRSYLPTDTIPADTFRSYLPNLNLTEEELDSLEETPIIEEGGEEEYEVERRKEALHADRTQLPNGSWIKTENLERAIAANPTKSRDEVIQAIVDAIEAGKITPGQKYY